MLCPPTTWLFPPKSHVKSTWTRATPSDLTGGEQRKLYPNFKIIRITKQYPRTTDPKDLDGEPLPHCLSWTKAQLSGTYRTSQAFMWPPRADHTRPWEVTTVSANKRPGLGKHQDSLSKSKGVHSSMADHGSMQGFPTPFLPFTTGEIVSRRLGSLTFRLVGSKSGVSFFPSKREFPTITAGEKRFANITRLFTHKSTMHYLLIIVVIVCFVFYKRQHRTNPLPGG